MSRLDVDAGIDVELRDEDLLDENEVFKDVEVMKEFVDDLGVSIRAKVEPREELETLEEVGILDEIEFWEETALWMALMDVLGVVVGTWVGDDESIFSTL